MNPVRLTLVILMCFSAFSAGMGLKQALAADASSSAEPAPACAYTLDAFTADVKAHGDQIVGYGKWNGESTTEALIVESDRSAVIKLVAFKDGCFVGVITLDAVAAPAAPSPSSKPTHLSGRTPVGTFA